MANEPKNLYQLEDFFRLYVMGVYYYIDEPVDWDKVNIKGSRDKDYWGFNYEFVDDKTTLVFPMPEGGDIIRGVYKLQGGDGEIVFEYGYTLAGVKKVQFVGNVNLNTYNLTDEGVEVSVEKTAFENKLRTRFDTKVSLKDTQDLDGNPVIPPTPLKVKLHSKRIKKYGRAEAAEQFEAPDVAQFGGSAWLQPDTTNIKKQEVEGLQAMPLGVTSIDPVQEDRFQYIAEESGKVRVSFRAKFSMLIAKLTLAGGVGNWQTTGMIRVFRGDNMVRSESPMLGRAFGSSPSWTAVLAHEFEFSMDFDLQKGDEVYCNIGISKTGSGIFAYYINAYEGHVEVTQETIAASSTCYGYKLQDAFAHVVRCITGKEAPVLSSFFGPGGCGEKFIVTNGFQIRGFQDRGVYCSLQDLLEGSHPIWFLGMQYTKDETGRDAIRLERVPSLFGKRRIYHCSKTWEYEEGHLKDATFNQAEIGYQKFAEEDLNTLDEFNTYQQYLLPITTYKATYTKKSKFIASGYSIEIVRREQFKVNPSTSLGTDDDLFIVAYVTEWKYKGIGYNFSGPYVTLDKPTDMQIGDTFQIATAGGINDLTVFTVVAKDDSSVERFRISPTSIADAGIGDLNITINGPQAERNEAFETVQNLLSPESSYNLRISPKRMLWNHAPFLNVGMVKKPGESVIKNTYTKNNGDMASKFSQWENCKMMEDNYLMQEGSSIGLQFFNGRKYMFLPEIATFKTQMHYDDLIHIKERMRGETDTDEDFGLISFYDLEGGLWLGYIWEFDYQPATEECSLTVRKVQKV